MKKIIFLFCIISVSYSQGIRSLNGSQLPSQKTVISYDDTASYFRWGISNGIHTLYIPYNLSPTVDTGGISSLNGLVTSAQVFAVDTTYSTSPVFVSSGSTHTLRIPMARINNKLNASDTTGFRTYSDSLYNRVDLTDIVTAPDYYTARQYMTSLAVDTIDDKSNFGGVTIDDTLDVPSGVIGVGNGSNDAVVNMDGGNSQTKDIRFQTGGVNRWIFRANATPETGANAGTNFSITARDDAGASLGDYLFIDRATGRVDILNALRIRSGQLTTETVSTSIFTAATSVSIGSSTGTTTINHNAVVTDSLRVAGDITIGSGNTAKLVIDGTDGAENSGQTSIFELGGSLRGTTRDNFQVNVDNDNNSSTRGVLFLYAGTTFSRFERTNMLPTITFGETQGTGTGNVFLDSLYMGTTFWGNANTLAPSSTALSIGATTGTTTINNDTTVVDRFRATGVRFNFVTKTADYTLTTQDYHVDVTTSGTTMTLPTAVGQEGRVYSIMNSSSGSITLATTSSQTIGNYTTATTLTILSDESYTVVSNGSNWRLK